MITHDGVLLPNFPGLSAGGPEKRFNAIRDLDTNLDDIVLATYPKSGRHLNACTSFFICFSKYNKKTDKCVLSIFI